MTDLPAQLPPTDPTPPAGKPFLSAVLCGPESDQPLSDSDVRIFPVGVFEWVDPAGPVAVSLSDQREMRPGHDEATLGAGRFDRIWRNGNNTISAIGRFDSDEDGTEAAGKVERRMKTGVSVNPRDYEYDIVWGTDDEGFEVPEAVIFTRYVICGATLLETPGFDGASIEVIDEDTYSALLNATDPMVVFSQMRPQVVTAGGPMRRLQAAANGAGESLPLASDLVSQAVSQAADAFADGLQVARDEIVVAAAASDPKPLGGPYVPPSTWFLDPTLDGPTPHTVTDEGRAFGHFALWPDAENERCHIGQDLGFIDLCVCPPKASYDLFAGGGQIMRCDDGSDLPIGSVTLRGGHFPDDGRAPLADVIAHYDETDAQVEYVAVGDDEWGPWTAGIVRSDISPGDLQTLRASSLSGHWREVAGEMRLIRICAVNTPGFPILAAAGGYTLPMPTGPRAHIVDGRVTALVAAGGTVQLARMKAERNAAADSRIGRYLSDRDADRFEERLAKVEARLREYEGSLTMLEPDIRARSRERMGTNGHGH